MNAATAINSLEPPVPPETIRRGDTGRFGLSPYWALFVLSMRQYLHGKRWMVVSALFLLPAALAILVRATARDVPSIVLEFLFVFLLIPQAILPLVALLYATGMILDEQEEQTITYLLIRPLRKWALYLVKLLATIATAVLLTAVFTTVTYLAIYLGAAGDVPNVPLRCLQAILIHSLAIATYCCLFGLVSLITRRSLLVGIIYIVVIEGVLANLPFGIRLMTIIYYTRLIAYRTLEFVVSTPRGTQNIAAEGWQFNIRLDPNLLEHPQLATSVEILVITSLVCAVLAAVVFSRTEFRVKTPTSN